MIVTFTNERGGAEKSILAHRLAILRATDGRKVLLLDTDPQQPSLTLCRERNAASVKPKLPTLAINGKGLQPELENLISRFNDIVIDAEGCDSVASRSALIAAQMAVIPILPDDIDPAREKALVRRIETARLFNPGLRVLFVIAGAKENLSPHLVARARALTAKIATATLANFVIHEQPPSCGAFDESLPISECQAVDKRAMVDMMNLYREVFKNEAHLTYKYEDR